MKDVSLGPVLIGFSVQPLCPLCLCGDKRLQKNYHRDTADTEIA
jgi:hypothetical protein